MGGTYEYIDKYSESFLSEFREFIRKPGISTENTGIDETVSWLLTKMRENGVDDTEAFRTKRHPVILGRAGERAGRTLLVYGHYDVQPPGDRKDWKADPFGAEIIDDRIIGRGTCDMKNNLMASLHAVKALLETRRSLPINLIFIFEGEEEIGSPNFKQFIEEHEEELSACDAILCGDGGGENKAGQCNLIYGLKGMLYVELSVNSPTGTEIHSMYAGITDNPAWRLVTALNSLKEGDKVLIPHFYDGVKEPGITEKMKYGLARMVISKEQFEGVNELKIRGDMGISDVLFQFMYKPTLNIDGLSSGYTVEKGMKTIVPDKAMAKIDLRLVPGQDAESVFENMRAHLARKGFSDIGMEKLSALPPYRVDPDEVIAKVAADAMKNVVSGNAVTVPVAPASGAMTWLPLILGRPMGFAGSGASYMGHRPNEFITEEQYLKGIKLFATIYSDYALV